jgi:drug/metabolite transporter (DMT)-like permease
MILSSKVASLKENPYFYGLIAVFFWSTVASAFKLTLRSLNFVEMLLYSTFFSFLILLIILTIQNRLGEIRRVSLQDIRASAVLGFINPFFYYLILFKVYSLLPAQLAQPLNFTWGIVIALLSIPLLKQKVKFKSIAAVFVSFIGVIIIASEGSISSLKFKEPFGVILAIASSLIWSLYWIFNARDKRDPVIKLFLNFSFGLFYIILFCVITHALRFPPLKGILGAAYIGFFEMGITFVLWLKAMKLAPTTAHVSILIYLSPFLSFIFIHFLVGETILLSSIIGLAFIVGGILWQQSGDLIKRRNRKRSQEK